MDDPPIFDVVTLGSATVEVYIETEKQTSIMKNIKGKETPFITFQSGEKVIINHLQFEVGGGGTNTATCFAKLGLDTGYCGAIGSHSNGKTVLRRLGEDGVAWLGTEVAEKTNYSVILESALLKDRTILVYKGASEHLVDEKIKPFHTRWVYTSSLSGESFATSIAIIGRHREHGGLIAVNPSNYQIEKNPAEVKKLLELTDVAVMNREEATALVGEGTLAEQMLRLRALGPAIVAITNGKEGSAVGNNAHGYYAAPVEGIPVRETTGAGDCFAATLVGAIALNQDLHTALRFAMINVEEHIQHVGAKAGFLTRDEIMARVAKDNRKFEDLY